MNAFQQFFLRLSVRILPPLRNLLTSAGWNLEDLGEELRMLRDANDPQRLRLLGEARDLSEAIALHQGSMGMRTAKEVGAREFSVVARCKESIIELEQDLLRPEWRRLTAMSSLEFSRWGIGQIILLSRLYFIKNPLVRRAVLLSRFYVFGRGIDISSPDETENEVIQGFLKDPRNASEMGVIGLREKHVTRLTDGNVFWVFFTAPDDGSVLVATVDALEIDDVISAPGNASEPWYYHRQWTEQLVDTKSGAVTFQSKQGWYLALGVEAPAGVKMINGQPIVMDENGMPVPMLHDKDGGLAKWKFGCPPVYAMLDWARGVKEYLENWASRNAALTRFAWHGRTKGGAPAIANMRNTLNALAGAGTVPGPNAGQTLVSGSEVNLDPIKVAGASDNPEQARRLVLMVCSAAGLPETFFGDASTGSLATAQSLDRPTELMYLDEQEHWREVLQRIFRYVLDQSSKAPNGKLREVQKGKQSTPVTIDVKFPSILVHDTEKRVAAIVAAMTLGLAGGSGGIDLKTGIGLLLDELGVEAAHELLDMMFPDAEYELNRVKQEPPAAPSAPTTKPTEALVLRALDRLETALVELKEAE